LQPEITTQLVKQFKLPNASGALVTDVEPNSPAAKAGFKEGDFIVEFAGKKVADMRQLRLMASQTAPGTKVTLRLFREGNEKKLSATLGSMPEEMLTENDSTQPNNKNQSKFDGLDGVGVTDLDASKRRELGVPNNIRGVLVSSLEPDSNSAEAGLQVGDVILELDRQPVRDAETAVTLSEKAKGDQILLRIWRGGGSGRGGTFYLPVDNTKRK
jgi:serine protease Do